MADDLIQKFFRDDLTEAEEKALSERLQGSTEDALRFGEEAEKRYQAYGLPDPEPPRPLARPMPEPPVHFLWLHAVLKALAVLLGLAVAGVVVLGVWRAFVPPDDKAAPPLPAASSPGLSDEAVVLQPSRPAAAARRTVPTATPDLSITVHKASTGPVTVQVLDMDGQTLRSLYQGILRQGDLSFEWDGKLADGSPAPSGLYRIRLESGGAPQEKIIRIP
ncbi:MAG TPA: FlgD immunoglobulin-like domain containing protein [bacterium]|nr:FlgD immunoglobulin-like domain containing protein [bacterium]